MKKKSSQIAKFLILLFSIILIVASMSVNVFAMTTAKATADSECSDGHTYKTTRTRATTSANGKRVTKCTECGKIKSTKTIYKVSSVKLSASKFTYNGEKKTPTVTVKDSKGNKLVKGEDYKVTYSSSKRTAVGRYSVKITFMGDYKGTKTLYFTIGPKNPATLNAKLFGYDDVKVSWSKVPGANGYRVYYKKSTSDTWSYTTTTGTSLKLSNLADGVKYNIKVCAYKTVNGNKCFNAGKTVSVTALKKITGVKVEKLDSGAKVSWSNINGETGYQISRSTSKTGTNIVSTYKTTSGKYKTVSATAGKTYYYKVRAYKEVDGKKIYGPWSAVVENNGRLTLDKLKKGNSYVAYVESVTEIAPSDKLCTQAQGCVFDGKYFYSAMIDYQDKCVIVVADKKGNIIRSSEPLDLDHANSITYVPKENALYVAHCTGSEEADYYTYSVVDKDSLKITKTVVQDYPMTCFAYCKEKDMFYSARWSGETLDIWNGKFEHTKTMDVTMRPTLSQGCYATKEGFWYARSYQNDLPNEMVMYDWDGNLIHEISFANLIIEREDIPLYDNKGNLITIIKNDDIKIEIEDIAYMDNGTVYIVSKSVSGKGTQVYEVTFLKQS